MVENGRRSLLGAGLQELCRPTVGGQRDGALVAETGVGDDLVREGRPRSGRAVPVGRHVYVADRREERGGRRRELCGRRAMNLVLLERSARRPRVGAPRQVGTVGVQRLRRQEHNPVAAVGDLQLRLQTLFLAVAASDQGDSVRSERLAVRLQNDPEVREDAGAPRLGQTGDVPGKPRCPGIARLGERRCGGVLVGELIGPGRHRPDARQPVNVELLRRGGAARQHAGAVEVELQLRVRHRRAGRKVAEIELEQTARDVVVVSPDIEPLPAPNPAGRTVRIDVRVLGGRLNGDRRVDHDRETSRRITKPARIDVQVDREASVIELLDCELGMRVRIYIRDPAQGLLGRTRRFDHKRRPGIGADAEPDRAFRTLDRLDAHVRRWREEESVARGGFRPGEDQGFLDTFCDDVVSEFRSRERLPVRHPRAGDNRRPRRSTFQRQPVAVAVQLEAQVIRLELRAEESPEAVPFARPSEAILERRHERRADRLPLP